ncbi:MAG: bifunctional glutamate N-acetyltransferase/amino-acid acetyltransferase ArgJ [Actinobacteria bacterium]|uniref:Arginine biosynthesis bifunctional protein ArgJ n=1 Tax=Candidatus Fonsibacter lacus TaxID=2576439 RepID=A0A965GCL2_9PROT|nr:bifunctional glutamate N-acetyltransferase/amino-acid acetyltransferase ArgJ [Candidatus Fonsibacter lacus]
MKFPKGFHVAGLAAGIKSSGAKDLALIVNVGRHKTGSAVFTKNRMTAAPVNWSKQVVSDGRIDAVLINSGGANACTGPDGFADTHKSAEYVANQLGVSATDVAICSTGLIGERLPLEKIFSGIDNASAKLAADNWPDVAEAIMTTDSHSKIANHEINGVSFVGIAKGAGMLAPALATMISVIATDAEVSARDLQKALTEATALTYDRLDSDGCTSTNDTVIALASGESAPLSYPDLLAGMQAICRNLADQLISDAEGHTKIIAIKTINAASIEDALDVSRTCARNNLLKCALFGEDPNWGRILAAVGTSAAKFDPFDLDVSINGVMVAKKSAPFENRSLVKMSEERIEIVIDVKAGIHEAEILTNDLSTMYVHENSAYSS